MCVLPTVNYSVLQIFDNNICRPPLVHCNAIAMNQQCQSKKTAFHPILVRCSGLDLEAQEGCKIARLGRLFSDGRDMSLSPLSIQAGIARTPHCLKHTYIIVVCRRFSHYNIFDYYC